MCSRKNLVLVLAVLVVAAGFATVARADTLYVAWKTSGTSGVVEGYDTAGNLVTSSTFITSSTAQPYCLAVSPKNGDIYLSLQQTPGPAVFRYDRTTGIQVGSAIYTGSPLATWPWADCFDSSGNLFVGPAATGTGTNKGGVDKVAADGTITYGWGTSASSARQLSGMALYGGKIYGVAYYSGTLSYWDATNGGAFTTLQTLTGNPYGEMCSDSSGNLYVTFRTYIAKLTAPYTGTPTQISVPADMKPENVIGISYYNNALYLGYTNLVNQMVAKYDLNAQSWSPFITGPATGLSNGPQMGWYIVPEPGTLALLACGLVGLLCYAWRKRK